MRHYTQLVQQRYQISALMKAGNSQIEIARIVGVCKSTVSRELRRKRGERGYRPRQAHRLALECRQDKARARLTPDDWNRIEAQLHEDCSPGQVSLWLAKEEFAESATSGFIAAFTKTGASGAICNCKFTPERF